VTKWWCDRLCGLFVWMMNGADIIHKVRIFYGLMMPLERLLKFILKLEPIELLLEEVDWCGWSLSGSWGKFYQLTNEFENFRENRKL
jgi:hypothetical protein